MCTYIKYIQCSKSHAQQQAIHKLIIFKVWVFGYKVIHGLAPPYLKELFVPVSIVPALSRNRDLHPVGTSSFHPQQGTPLNVNEVLQWRTYLVELLPLEIRNSSSMQTFRSRLKTYLFREAYNISGS